MRIRHFTFSDKDILILQLIEQNKSIDEIREALGLKSTNSVARRLKQMESHGIINPPPKVRMARSRTLTELGKEALNVHGIKPKNAAEGTVVR